MNNNSVEQPDPDNIKMFVGQVPHDMDENDLRKLFEEFGRVHQINILRDKITGSHRGKRPSAYSRAASIAEMATWNEYNFNFTILIKLVPQFLSYYPLHNLRESPTNFFF